MPPELEQDGESEDSAEEESGGGGSTDIIGGFDGTDDADAAAEATMETGNVDLGLDGDDDIVAGFDGVEGEEEESDSSSSGSSSSGSSGKGDPSIESAIENGLAEVAAMGLEGSERERVSGEMQQIAEKFRVGYFGQQVAEKYLKKDIEDIPPEYGLVAALIGFAALAIYKRPDGEKQVRHAVSVVQEKFSGGDEPPEPPAPPQPPQAQQSRPQERRDASVAEQAGARSDATRRSQNVPSEPRPDVAETEVPDGVEAEPAPQPADGDTNE